jgi:3-methyl-2-oxobutanoate hydroxymethyltransferase
MTKAPRKTIPEIRAHKGRAEALVSLTCYTTPMAKILDPHVDILLVGDSIGMVMYGMENTLGVDLEMMIRHGQAVMRGASTACVIVDMPFGTYEESPEHAYRNAARLMKESGCDAVKLEGGVAMVSTIKHLTSRNIPVMGHIGLLPQSVIKDGGYKVKGRKAEEVPQLITDAKAVEEAGAFAMVLEGTVHDVAAQITKAVSIPIIGIGASPECDGQVLVIDDMLGMLENPPKFVKEYADLKTIIDSAAAQYAADVRVRKFPGAEQLYTRPQSVKNSVDTGKKSA